MRNILLMKENNFDLETDDTIIERFKVEGGPTTVRSIISKDTYVNNFKFLQNNNIRYIDQIISLSKRYLLTIKELEDRKYIRLNLKGKLSANINNYEQIREELTISPHTYKLKEYIVKQIDGVDKVENLRGVEIIPVIANTRKDVPIIIELNTGGSLQAVFGRTRKVLPGGLLIAMHMIPITTIEDKDLILEKCQRCNITTWLDVPEVMFSNQERSRIPCIIMTDAKNASTFSRNKWQNGINQNNILGHEKIIFPGISGQIIQENFIYDRILKQQPYLYKSTYSKIHEMIPKDKISFLNNILSQFLKTGNYKPMTNRMQLCKNRLTTIRGRTLKIYIDGSVKFNKTENIEAIFGLMIYDEDNKLLDTIMSTVEDWITVNKTEALAFLAALLIIPEKKEVTIYTDSQTNYDNFMAIKQRPHRNNLRDILKFGTSNHIWAIIKNIIFYQNLDVKVVKIKAHAEDALHNILDKEIKERYADIQGVSKLEVIPTCAEYRYNLITETIDKLIDLLIQNGVDAKKIIKEDLIDLPMFQRAKNTNEFCFIDMIKGIFPLSLSRIILFFIGVSKEKLARTIGIEILNFIFTKINSGVWKRRCEAMKQTEKSLGISKMDKKKPDSIFTKEKEKELQSKRYLGNYPLFEGLISVKEHILFGVVIRTQNEITEKLKPFFETFVCVQSCTK
ncbi:17485_t:CDS:2 [Rhizophagus irregularis]|nr:17485_t:CDS:2 [Rhizophagus irregularis]